MVKNVFGVFKYLAPNGGWKNYGRQLLQRLSELNGTPREIAAGVACGAAVSFTPFVGIHLILAVVTAWIMRANVLASALGTVVGNPWTFPFIWVAVLYIGRTILGMGDVPTAQVDFTQVFEKSLHALMTFDFSLFFSDIWPILWPMMIGCIPFYIIVWVVTYYLTKTALKKVWLHKEDK